MADKSHIEWTDATWNPVTGCTVLSPGCTHCYAMKLAGGRLRHHPSRAGLTTQTKSGPVWNGTVRFNEGWLLQPMEWRKPRMIFVCAHGDLFHEDVPDDWIDKVFAVMALAPQHTFQVLTKRAARMRDYLKPFDSRRADGLGKNVIALGFDGPLESLPWPLPNVWLGVSAERQQELDERAPQLLQTPAAVRFLSVEPLLGPMDLRRWMPQGRWGSLKGAAVHIPVYFMTRCEHCNWYGSSELCPLSQNHDDADVVCPQCHKIFLCDDADGSLDWVIVGGESGDRARAMHPQWARSLRDQCAAANVPFFFKQWGNWAPSSPERALGNPRSGWCALSGNRPAKAAELYPGAGAEFVERMTKATAGRHLDGQLHNAMPEVR